MCLGSIPNLGKPVASSLALQRNSILFCYFVIVLGVGVGFFIEGCNK